jgi:hypothetical protein
MHALLSMLHPGGQSYTLALGHTDGSNLQPLQGMVMH